MKSFHSVGNDFILSSVFRPFIPARHKHIHFLSFRNFVSHKHFMVIFNFVAAAATTDLIYKIHTAAHTHTHQPNDDVLHFKRFIS